MREEKLRKKIIKFSGLLEVYISILIIIAVSVFSINIVIDIVKIIPALFTDENSFFVEQFLGRSLELVIAIEFVKMIAHNTPGSTIEVLIFTIARSIIATHGNSLYQLLFGILAIAVLFGIRKWAHKYDRSPVNVLSDNNNREKGIFFNANMLVTKIGEIIGKKIPARKEDTVGKLVESCLRSRKGGFKEGDMLEIGGVCFIVDKIKDENIEQVEVLKE